MHKVEILTSCNLDKLLIVKLLKNRGLENLEIGDIGFENLKYIFELLTFGMMTFFVVLCYQMD